MKICLWKGEDGAVFSAFGEQSRRVGVGRVESRTVGMDGGHTQNRTRTGQKWWARE
jgi:hypothetical protein